MQQESSSSSGIFKLLDPASSSASVGGGLNTTTNNNSVASEQDSRKRNLNYRFHFLESDEDDMLSAGSSVGADRSGGASGGDENTHSGAGGKFSRYREVKENIITDYSCNSKTKKITKYIPYPYYLANPIQKSKQEADVV